MKKKDAGLLSRSQLLEIVILTLLLFFLISSYISMIQSVSKDYLPVSSDEYFYYVNAHSFYINKTLQASLTFNGTGSKILGADAHGFAYPLLHGIIAKTVGWNSLNFIITNLLIILISVVTILLTTSITVMQRLWVIAFILVFPLGILYSFTFMQETIHILFAVVLSIIIMKINSKGIGKKLVLLFALTVFIAGIFRPLWFFYLPGLLPFAKSKKHFFQLFLLTVTGIFFSYIVISYFIEHVPSYSSFLIGLLTASHFKGFMLSFTNHLILNFSNYFSPNDILTFSMRMIFGISTILFLIIGFRYRSKLHLSIALIGFINFILLFSLYDTTFWRDIRVLAPCFYFFIMFIVVNTNRYVKYIYMTVLVFMFILTIPISFEWIAERRYSYNMENLKLKAEYYSAIADEIESGKIVYIDNPPFDNSSDFLVLPLQNSKNSQIRYIVPHYFAGVQITEFQYYILGPNKSLGKNEKIIIDNVYYQLIGM